MNLRYYVKYWTHFLTHELVCAIYLSICLFKGKKIHLRTPIVASQTYQIYLTLYANMWLGNVLYKKESYSDEGFFNFRSQEVTMK